MAELNNHILEEEDDVFLDAEESPSMENGSTSPSHHQNKKLDGISLGEGLEEGQRAIDMFFNNDFEGARDLTFRYRDQSIYHALGYGTFNYLKAVMTFEQEHVETASRVLSESINTIQTFRKKGGLGDMVKGKDYNDMTENEVHAELVFAECLMLKAMLTIVEDENLVSFVKAGLKVRQAYVSFKECWSILNKRDWSKDQHKHHFEGGVRLGVGTFNLLMSLLPARITKLMEFVGFSATKEIGMKELMACYKDTSCLRQFLSALILLGYNLFLNTNMGKHADCDRKLVEEILNEKLTRYPQGAFFLFFKGRYEMISGRCESASSWYIRANESQVSWPGFQHVGCWELLWSACFRTQWREALVYADRLVKESRWSPCIYSYLKAAIYSQVPDLTDAEKEEQIALMTAVPKLKQRIGGKSIPSEKFAIKKAEKFISQKNRLLLPALEMVYLWHGFSVLIQNFQLLENFLNIVQQARKENTELEKEDAALLNLLEGMCLKHMGCPLQAEEKFQNVLSSSNDISVDKYLVPFTMVELAILLMEQGDLKGCKDLLNKAKTMNGYCLQSRLHFKIHATSNKIKNMEKEAENGTEAKEEFHDAEDDLGLDLQPPSKQLIKLKPANLKHRFSRSISECTEVNPHI